MPAGSRQDRRADKDRIALIGPGSTRALPARTFGNKAANLAKMAALGIPVPPAFVLGVSVCDDYYRNGDRLPDDVPELLERGLRHLEAASGLRYGDRRRPLLVSVRSGAPVSLPGLMETLLNVGLSRQTVEGLVFMTGNPRFAWDSYRRLVQGVGETVYGHDSGLYETALAHRLRSEDLPDLSELDSRSMRALATEYEELFAETAGARFPVSPAEQLKLAVTAVLRSAHGPRVDSFVRAEMLRGAPSTAVTVQAMVFGNAGMNSGAGVAFTRDPATGAAETMVDFKLGAQGDDVVSGKSTGSAAEFTRVLPAPARELEAVCHRLEKAYGDMQDIEFTVQEKKLFILQSRSGKRAPLAALRIAVEMVAEGLLDPEEARVRLAGVDLDEIVITKVDTTHRPLARGESASTGVASGRAAFGSESAEAFAANGPTILIADSLTPDDLPGVAAAGGVLVARGARTSHAAVVARQLGKVCIVNCPDLVFDPASRKASLGRRRLKEGDIITLDGNTGDIYLGEVTVTEERPEALLATVSGWSSPESV
jgi:pyruvate,orthophosphate dikinase